MTESLLWPKYATPADVNAIEAVPLAERGLPASTYELLVRAATRWPDRTAITVLPEASQWRHPLHRTFAELLADVHRFANLFHFLGVRRGDAVALMAPNCAELISATLAAQLAGIAAPLNAELPHAQLTELLRLSGARVLVTAGPELDTEVWKIAQDLAADGTLDAVLALEPTSPGTPVPLPAGADVRTEYLADLATGMVADTFAGDPPSADDLAGLFHTGGTTGAPKLAAQTHANQVANSWMLAADSELDQDTTVFAAVPLFHVTAFVITLLAPLFKGQRVVWAGPLGYQDPALYGEYWKIVEHHGITAMSAIPSVYAKLATCPVDADISSLRYATVGGAPLPAAVRESFRSRTGLTLAQGYGLTEATCETTRSFPGAPRPAAVGQRLPYYRAKVVGAEDHPSADGLPTGQIGVLMLSGPTVFPGYVAGWDRDGRVLDGLGTLVDGWLDTGDLARIDDDGFVYLHGRAKDLIICGGHNIDPASIEEALLAHPEVSGASVVGRPDVHAGEVPVAYVTLAPGATVTEQKLFAWATMHVADRAAALKAVTVLDAFPVTNLGKPYKRALHADATRRAVTEALTGLCDDDQITTVIEDGAVAVKVAASLDTDQAAVKTILDRYPIRWTVQ